MKRFSYLYILTALLATATLAGGCTKGFDEFNTNPHELTDDELSRDYQNVGAFFSQMVSRVVLYDDGSGDCLSSDYQVAQGLSADAYSGYLTPTGTWYNGVHNGSYSFVSGWYDQLFTRAFSEVMPAWQRIRSQADRTGQPAVAALADIIKVEALHRVTDMYGPIPYTGFGRGAIGTAYDPQQTVYRTFLAELDSAITVLTPLAQSGETLLPKYDNVYEGNVANWVRFANTLRLRLALRVVYADEQLARTEAEKSAACPLGFIEQTAQRAQLLHSRINYFHPNYDIAYNFNAGEVRMGATMDCYLNGYGDPRRASYFTMATADNAYHGVRLGVHRMNPTKYAGTAVSNLNITPSVTPIVWMTAAEGYFLRAEATLRGWAMGGTARQFYEAGIRASFAENDAAGADDYVANTTAKPAKFTDKTGGRNNYNAPSEITIAWDDSAPFETNLERIITQKWIAMYPDGCEGWAEFRRTGYPRLLPVVNNDSQGTVDTQTQVRRCPFPVQEYNTNSDAVNAAVGVLNAEAAAGQGDNGGTRLWWDKKASE